MKTFLEILKKLSADAIRIFSATVLLIIVVAVFIYALLAIFGGTRI